MLLGLRGHSCACEHCSDGGPGPSLIQDTGSEPAKHEPCKGNKTLV